MIRLLFHPPEADYSPVMQATERVVSRGSVVMLLITGAHFFHHQLTALVVPLLPFMRDGFNLTYTQAGGLVSAFSLSYGIGQLPAGWLADRIGARYLLLAGISGVALAGLLVGVSGTYGLLVLSLILMGLMGGGYHPSATPIISTAVPPAQRGRAMGMHLVGGSASHLVAPLLGVAIATALGWRGSFLIIGGVVFFFGIAVFVLFRRLTFAGEEAVAGGQGLSSPPARSAVPIWLFVSMTSLVAAITASTIAFIPLYLVDHIGLTEGAAAIALAVFFSAGLWAAPLGGIIADRIGALTVFGVIILASGPLIFLLGAVHSATVVVAILLLLGMTLFVRMTVSESYLIGVIPPARRSTVLGVYFFAGMEGSGIVTPLLGNLIDRLGFQAAFAVSGGFTLAAIVVLGILGLVLHRRAAPGGAVLPQ